VTEDDVRSAYRLWFDALSGSAADEEGQLDMNLLSGEALYWQCEPVMLPTRCCMYVAKLCLRPQLCLLGSWHGLVFGMDGMMQQGLLGWTAC
jgi:hypothetical protein